jgi:two-component system, cell cycle sensor histidine kinase and response regulator CckA
VQVLCEKFHDFDISSLGTGFRRQHPVNLSFHPADVSGERITMMLPQKSEKPVVRQRKIDANAPLILLVEDDASVRNLVTRLLTLNGYSVLSATNGNAALELWQQHRENITLLLTDVVMPEGISGCELGAACLAENPALKIIYTSGYNVELAQNGWLREGAHFVQKPYRPEQLLAVVRGVLAGSPNPCKDAYVANSSGR